MKSYIINIMKRKLYYYILIFFSFLLSCCIRIKRVIPDDQKYLIITPYDKDENALTGTLSIWSYKKSSSQENIKCLPDNDSEKGKELPSYPVRLIPGHYKISAYDSINDLKCHKDVSFFPAKTESAKFIDFKFD